MTRFVDLTVWTVGLTWAVAGVLTYTGVLA